MRIIHQFLLGLCLLWLVVPAVQAKEPVEDFFQGLLERGYYTQALWYLDSIEQLPTLAAEDRERLNYRRAIAEIEAARRSPNLDRRQQLLASAETHLAEFLKEHPESDRAIDALIQRGNVLSDQARLSQAYAKREDAADAKKPHLDKAREQYEQARKIFTEANGKIREVLTSLGNVLDPKKDAKKIEYRDEMRASYIQTQLLATNSMFERAKLLAANDENRKKLLEQAAKEFGETYGKYKTRLAGLYSRLYEAQALQELGKRKEVLAIYLDDLMLLQDQPAQIRIVKLKASIGLTKLWRSGEKKELGKILSDIAPWLQSQQLRASEQRDDDWLELKLLVARTYLEDAEARKNDDKLRGDHRREALKLAVDVARYPNPFQQEALELRTALQGTQAVAQEKPEPKSFEEAMTAGRELINEANAQKFVVTKLEQQQQAASDQAAKDELAGQIEQEQSSLKEMLSNARTYFEQALLLADRDVPQDEINSVHYFLSYLGFQADEFWQTYVRASHVSRHYPNSPSAKICAKLALASALRLYDGTSDSDKQFELGLIQETANFIARQWPDSEDAGQALVALINFQVQQAGSKELPWQRQFALLAEAEKTASKIADDSASKASAQLKVGQTYWSLFLNGSALRRQTAEDASQTDLPSPEQLAETKQKAQEILAAGIASFQGDEPDYTYVLGALSLAQVYTDIGQPLQAVALLEKPQLGLMNLVEQNSPATSRPGIDQMIYKAAVRAYISALPSTTDPAKTESLMASAEKAMSQLQNLAGSDTNSQRQLVAIYISLANDLKQQLDNADAASKQALAGAFEQFLNRVAESTNEANVLNWVGETFYNLGQSFQEDPSFTGDSRTYFDKATAAYQKILDSGDSDSLNPALVQQVRVRVAMAQRETGSYEEAIATFKDVLSQNNAVINVQVEAAKTYYLWGLNGGDPQSFYRSLMGGEPNPQTRRNIIWGWGRIQAMLARYASAEAEPSPYKDVFFEARYYLAQCRYHFALAQENPDEKEKLLKLAVKDIQSTQTFDPSLGGEAWWSKFDALMRKIQKDLTGQPSGLAKK